MIAYCIGNSPRAFNAWCLDIHLYGVFDEESVYKEV